VNRGTVGHSADLSSKRDRVQDDDGAKPLLWAAKSRRWGVGLIPLREAAAHGVRVDSLRAQRPKSGALRVQNRSRSQ